MNTISVERLYSVFLLTKKHAPRLCVRSFSPPIKWCTTIKCKYVFIFNNSSAVVDPLLSSAGEFTLLFLISLYLF